MDIHILALETSSSLCGVALLSATPRGVTVHATGHNVVGEHAERLLPMVQQVLDQAGVQRSQLTAVGFGQGPGGFTGLRVACGAAQGIAYALGVPVVPVESLLAAAALDHAIEKGAGAACGATVRVVVQDARMEEVYLGAYRREPDPASGVAVWRVEQAPVLLAAADVADWMAQYCTRWHDKPQRPTRIRLLGDALARFPALRALGGKPGQEPRIELGAPVHATAEAVARLALESWQRGHWVLPESAAPLYVRDKVAYTTSERQQGLGGNPKADAATVSIEPMTETHLDDVAEIERTVQSFPWSRRNFSDALKAGYASWVARQGGRTVGFCMVMFAPDVAHLLLIAVARDYQHKGIGSLLLHQCVQESQSRSLPGVILEVRPSNQNAVMFYQRRGFTSLGVRKGYYPSGNGKREDAWVLQKKLTVSKAAHG